MINLNSCKGAKEFMFFSRSGVKCTITEKTRSGHQSRKFSRSAERKNNTVLFLSCMAANYIPVCIVSILVISTAFLAFLLYFKQAVERHIPLRISAHEIPYKTARKVIFLYKRALCGITSRILKPDDVRS